MTAYHAAITTLLASLAIIEPSGARKYLFRIVQGRASSISGSFPLFHLVHSL